MGIRSTKSAVYDLKYHLVWVPKYRKPIFDDEINDVVFRLEKEISGMPDDNKGLGSFVAS